MRALWLVPALILTALPGAAANVEVRVNKGRVDLKLPGAALSEVLGRLSSTLGFKLTRDEGVSDPFLPALEFIDRTPVETVLGVLDGQGLNYAITMDASGVTVESLLLSATKPSGQSTSPTRSSPLPAVPRFPRMPSSQPEANDDANVIEPPDVTMPAIPEEEPPVAPPPPPPPVATPPGPRPMRLP